MARHGSHRTLKAKIGGLYVEIKKNRYDGLWYVRYMDVMQTRWAGPFKTQREAAEKLSEHCDGGLTR